MSQHLIALPAYASAMAPVKTLISIVRDKSLFAIRVAVDTALLWQQRSRERQELAGMDARMRRDIGLSRADVWHEVNKPLWRA